MNAIISPIKFDKDDINNILKTASYHYIHVKEISEPFLIDINLLFFKRSALKFPYLPIDNVGEIWIPLVVLKNHKGTFTVIDGYHRFVAWRGENMVNLII